MVGFGVRSIWSIPPFSPQFDCSFAPQQPAHTHTVGAKLKILSAYIEQGRVCNIWPICFGDCYAMRPSIGLPCVTLEHSHSIPFLFVSLWHGQAKSLSHTANGININLTMQILFSYFYQWCRSSYKNYYNLISLGSNWIKWPGKGARDGMGCRAQMKHQFGRQAIANRPANEIESWKHNKHMTRLVGGLSIRQMAYLNALGPTRTAYTRQAAIY